MHLSLKIVVMFDCCKKAVFLHLSKMTTKVVVNDNKSLEIIAFLCYNTIKKKYLTVEILL